MAKYIFSSLLFFLLAANGHACKVLFVCVDTTDATIVRIAEEFRSSNFTIDFVHNDSIASMTETDYQQYDVAFFSDQGGSSALTEFTSHGIRTIPFVNLETYVLDNWGWITVGDDSWYSAPKDSSVNDYEFVYTGIVWEDHPILGAVGFEKWDEFQWTTSYNVNMGEYAQIQCFDLKQAYPEIADNALMIATNKFAEYETGSNVDGWLWAVEENDSSRRGVVWGVSHLFLENATDDFYKILVNALNWANYNSHCVPPNSTTLWRIEVNGLDICGFKSANAMPMPVCALHNEYSIAPGTTQIPQVVPYTWNSQASAVVNDATNLQGNEQERTTSIFVTSADKTATQTYTVTFLEGSTAVINNQERVELKVYPVPASENIIVDYAHPINSILIMNTTGQVLINKNHIEKAKMSIDISELANGIYLLQAISGNKVLTRKFTKK